MPHFYKMLPDEFAALSDAAAVNCYAAGAGLLAPAITGLSRDQLCSFPIPGTWSIQQIVAHLMDTDLIAAYRMKRIIAENRPRIDVYDENAMTARLGYERLDAGRVCEVFRLNRLLTAELLRGLAPSAFARAALHPEIGELPLGALVRLYAWHVEHHLRFIQQKRSLLLGDLGFRLS